MTEHATTADMLAQIGTGTAAELVMAVRYNTCPPGPTFIPELDAHLLSARAHPGGSALRRGDLVEVVGPSGSGKTALCHFLLVTTLLPPTLTLFLPGGEGPLDIPLGGRGMAAALLVPPSHADPLPPLERGMRAHVTACVRPVVDTRAPAVEDAIHRAVAHALAKLTLIRPKARAVHWALALRRLLHPLGTPTGAGPGTAADLVVCDGFADGFWPDRWADKQRADRGQHPKGDRRVRGADDAGMRDVWDAVTDIRRGTGAVVVLCVQGLRPLTNTPFFKPHLPAPYPSPFLPRDATHTIPEAPSAAWPLNIQLTLLGPARPLQFPAETTLVDALRRRRPADGVQVHSAVVRVPGGEGMAGTSGGARWSFGVGEDGLVPFTA